MASNAVKTGLKLAAGLLVLLLAPGMASAQLTMANTRPLAFGRFVAGAGGTVSVTPGGARTSVGVLLLPSEASPAQFELHDTNPDNASNAVVVTLPPDGDVVLKSDANSMSLSGFSSDLPSHARLTPSAPRWLSPQTSRAAITPVQSQSSSNTNSVPEGKF
jgi:hypothetical protein